MLMQNRYIYFSLNTDNRLNYGPSLENIVYHYLASHEYKVSVGKIGNLECDFIVRRRITTNFGINKKNQGWSIV